MTDLFVILLSIKILHGTTGKLKINSQTTTYQKSFILQNTREKYSTHFNRKVDSRKNIIVKSINFSLHSKYKTIISS